MRAAPGRAIVRLRELPLKKNCVTGANVLPSPNVNLTSNISRSPPSTTRRTCLNRPSPEARRTSCSTRESTRRDPRCTQFPWRAVAARAGSSARPKSVPFQLIETYPFSFGLSARTSTRGSSNNGAWRGGRQGNRGTALGAWWRAGHTGLLAGGLLLGAVVPFTLLGISPTNRRLLAPSLDPESAEAAALLRRWGRLHAVRSALGALAFGTLLVLRRADVTEGRAATGGE